MSCRLAKDLKTKHRVRHLPIVRSDEVKILKGNLFILLTLFSYTYSRKG